MVAGAGLSFRQQVAHNPDTDLYRVAYWALASIVSYCLLPLLAIRLIDRRPLSDFGLAWPDRATLKADLAFPAVLRRDAALGVVGVRPARL